MQHREIFQEGMLHESQNRDKNNLLKKKKRKGSKWVVIWFQQTGSALHLIETRGKVTNAL